MTTEAGVPVRSKPNLADKHERAWETFGNIIGVVTGVPAFVLGICALAGSLNDVLNALVGAILLLISVGLLLPSRSYDHGKTRAIGFAALSLATAVTISCAAVLGWFAYNLLSDPPDEYGWWVLVAMIGVGCLIAFVYAISCTCVLVFKVKPKAAHAAIGIAAGIVVGLLIAVLMYLLHFRHW
jgi:divalent metal cation (Fe/Co/Zn/Cd) transporter